MPRHAIVTGASSGIGLATACALADAGVRVLAVARRADRLASLATRDLIEPVVADVRHADGVGRVAEAVGSRSIDVLVHGAGIFPRGRLLTVSHADWQDAWATNVTSRLALLRTLRTALASGRVLFIGSDAARTPRAGGAAYSVTQAASEMLWRCCRIEVPNVAFALAKPGLVTTDMMHASLRAPRDAFPAGEVYADLQARGETIAPETIARFFRFLLLDTDRAEFESDVWDVRDASHHGRWLEGSLYVRG